MFDSQIQPILTFGYEIWGLSDNQECIERVRLSVLKKCLGVSSKSPRHLIYGETGRYSLYVHTYARSIKFWLRLTCMDDKRYPRNDRTAIPRLVIFEMFYTSLVLVFFGKRRVLGI